MIGTGNPVNGRSFNDAVWLACLDMKEVGIKAGMVRIFEPNGKFCADTDINNPGYYGDLKWFPAPVYVIDAKGILAAAAK
jgi:hypothetical protein